VCDYVRRVHRINVLSGLRSDLSAQRHGADGCRLDSRLVPANRHLRSVKLVEQTVGHHRNLNVPQICRVLHAHLQG